ncbi:MAG TPA: hypothetical protein PLD27_00340 [bacterium]|nr:hypothetical protein [bacterium]HOL48876.1 hypothetical protein [bacterium]HPQ18133.1 hypothetical protein [bacterium]
MFDLAIAIIIILFVFGIIVITYILKIKRAKKEIEILNQEIMQGRKERERLKTLKEEIKKGSK